MKFCFGRGICHVILTEHFLVGAIPHPQTHHPNPTFRTIRHHCHHHSKEQPICRRPLAMAETPEVERWANPDGVVFLRRYGESPGSSSDGDKSLDLGELDRKLLYVIFYG